MPPSAGSDLTATQPTERIELLDILRGFALFGVLLVNTLYFSGYSVLGDEFSGLPDRIASQGINLLARQKFVTIFSFLFGVGFVLQMKKVEARGSSFNRLFLRRLIVLLGIGLVHALLDPGEVLHKYALLGMLLLLLRSVSTRVVMAIAVLLAALPYLLSLVTPSVAQFAPEYPEIYAGGSLAEVLMLHAGQFVSGMASWVGNVWLFSVFAPLAFGAYAGRREVFERIDAILPQISRQGWWCLGVGVGGTLTALLAFRYPFPYGFVAGGLLWTLGVWGLALFYVVRISVIVQSRRLPRLFAGLGAVGRLTLTNFVMQSIICTSLFYAYGFGLYGTFGAAACVGLTIVIYVLQVVSEPLVDQALSVWPARMDLEDTDVWGYSTHADSFRSIYSWTGLTTQFNQVLSPRQSPRKSHSHFQRLNDFRKISVEHR